MRKDFFLYKVQNILINKKICFQKIKNIEAIFESHNLFATK